MKKLIIVLSFFSSIVLLASYRLNNLIADLFTEIGISQQTAENNIFKSITYGYPALIKPGNLAQLVLKSGGYKAALTKEACSYIKNYCNSDEFKTRYEEYRQSKKPQVPQFSEEEKKMQLEIIAQQEEMYTPEVLAYLPPEAKEAALASIKDMKASINGELSETQKKEWEEAAPSDPNVLIKKELKLFLDETKDVDYNAATYKKDGRILFSNPDYERKNGLWKYCYRSGKDVAETARAFAKSWLAEME